MRTKILLGLTIFLAFVLRFYQLGTNPPSLYWDEASLGYNAFSIATTLHDEHGEFLPVTRFIAFGDYKPPGYIYAAAAAVKLFGLSEFSVRLPSALAGTLLVLLTYFLAKELKAPALLSSIFVAISPWALQFSRGAFEANLATLFSGLGILFFLRGKYKISALTFALAMYTFNTHRVFVPLMIVALVAIFRPLNKKLLVGFLLFVVLLIPLAQYGFTREARLRFDEVSWANDLAPIELSNQRITTDGGNVIARIVHNRRVVYTLEFLKHYLDTVHPDFLFFKGDVNFRLSTQIVGELYLVDLPFLLAGIYFLIRHRTKASAVLFSWALLAPIPAAFARETPHALRTLNLLPVPQILVAIGLARLVRLRWFVVALFGLFFGYYLYQYHLVYPLKYASSWQYGYKQAVAYVTANEAKYDHISVTPLYGRPYIYFLFYQNFSPQKYWESRDVSRDWYGFWTVHGFDEFVFNDSEGNLGKWLYLRGPGQSPKDARLLTTVTDLTGNPVFEISEKRY